ncbi:hypothetical protein B0H21DRAFT_119465 [Amylocystis lapponica]|nr:hypothetical protein B0H21DRAFT_119465 [Amylocystis lapponica]
MSWLATHLPLLLSRSQIFSNCDLCHHSSSSQVSTPFNRVLQKWSGHYKEFPEVSVLSDRHVQAPTRPPNARRRLACCTRMLRPLEVVYPHHDSKAGFEPTLLLHGCCCVFRFWPRLESISSCVCGVKRLVPLKCYGLL